MVESRDGVAALSEREKQTLRLLLSGHDAKSIARHFGLSVHTINERLRDARRKLGLSSSREAARLLAEVERDDPHSFVDKQFGVGAGGGTDVNEGRARRREAERRRVASLGGGLLVMLVIVAAVALSFAANDNGGSQQATAPNHSLSTDADVRSARAWAELLDKSRWNESWREAAGVFKSKLSEARWGSTIQSVRGPLGPASSRALKSVTKVTSLPGLPDGEYESVQFQTDFARKKDAIETIGLAHESSGWKVIGYFIR